MASVVASGVSRTAAALLLLAAVTSAQAPAPAPRRFVAIGCLTSAASPKGKPATAFIVTDRRDEKPLVYRLDGDPAQLKVHVGHTVEVSGPITPGSAAAKDSLAGAPLMKVETLIWISSTCQPPVKK